MARRPSPTPVETRFGHLVDVYALGVVAFELLTGQPPFAGEEVMDFFRAHTTFPSPPVGSLRPDAPESLAQLVDRMLAKDPMERPADMESVAWSLRRARTEAAATGGSHPTRRPGGGGRRRHREAGGAAGEEVAPSARIERSADALDAMKRLSAWTPDVLVLDLHMPHMSGVELAMHLQGTPVLDRCVTIAVSAGASATDRALLRQLGITRYVEKGKGFSEAITDHVRLLLDGKAPPSSKGLRHGAADGAFLNALGEAVLVTDNHGDPMQWNEEADRLLKMGSFTPGSLDTAWLERDGVYAADGTTPLAPEARPIGRALRGERVEGVEMVVGSRRMVVSARPLRRSAGEVVGAVAIFREAPHREG